MLAPRKTNNDGSVGALTTGQKPKASGFIPAAAVVANVSRQYSPASSPGSSPPPSMLPYQNNNSYKPTVKAFNHQPLQQQQQMMSRQASFSDLVSLSALPPDIVAKASSMKRGSMTMASSSSPITQQRKLSFTTSNNSLSFPTASGLNTPSSKAKAQAAASGAATAVNHLSGSSGQDGLLMKNVSLSNLDPVSGSRSGLIKPPPAALPKPAPRRNSSFTNLEDFQQKLLRAGGGGSSSSSLPTDAMMMVKATMTKSVPMTPMSSISGKKKKKLLFFRFSSAW
jgi:hypothetical protein